MASIAEISAWRKMVKPLVAAAIALCMAGTAYFKAHTEVGDAHESSLVKAAETDAQIRNLEFRVIKVERDAELLKASLSGIASDVSYIRGKLEASDNRRR